MISKKLPVLELCLVAFFLLSGSGALAPSNVKLRSLPDDDQPERPGTSAQEMRWAIVAFTYIQTLDCSDAFFTSEEECKNLVRTPRSDMALHMAGPQSDTRYLAVLPDGGLSRTRAHDAVVVIDPFPEANFGHLVVVFYVDLGTTRAWCEREGGTFLDGGDCLILATKKRCRNNLERRGRRRNMARRCEINFIPKVFLENDHEHQQRLTCRVSVAGFGACPQLRPEGQGSDTACDPLEENSKRCELSQDKVQTSCRAFEICDQAVLLSGGWESQVSLPRHLSNLQNMYRMLRAHGFKRRNIELFFADGLQAGLEVPGEDPHEVHPSSSKLPMRFHLQGLCGLVHCVDSLVLYLNSPAKNDGTMLLWDEDEDGVASERETYSQTELLSDLENCNAAVVHIIVDQSYAGDLARVVKRSPHHQNVVVYASSRDHEYSWGTDFTDLWANTNHTHQCAQDVHRTSRRQPMRSTPETEQGDLVTDSTIFGAPCGVDPPFSPAELRHEFLGCQNIPTSEWITKFRERSRAHDRVLSVMSASHSYD